MSEDHRSRVRSLCFFYKDQAGIEKVQALVKQNEFQPHNGHAIEWLEEQEANKRFEKITEHSAITSRIATIAAAISAFCAIATIFFLKK